MKNTLTTGFAFFVLMLLHANVWALTFPNTEDFQINTANWRNSASSSLDFQAAGGPDGSSHVSSNLNFFGTSSTSRIVFRGHDFFDSSNDSFVGNWISAGVGRLSAYVRHNATEPLSFFARIATQNNNPGVAIELPGMVQPNTWTKLDFLVSPSNPLLTIEGPPSAYNAALGAVGNVQFGLEIPTSLALTDFPYTFQLDKVSIGVPEPTSLALLASSITAGLVRRRRRAL